MLTETRQIILANQITYGFDSLVIDKSGPGSSLCARVTFYALNENGERLPGECLTFVGDDFATFAKNFNTWTFLYEELAKLKGLSLPEPGAFEDEFNKI